MSHISQSSRLAIVLASAVVLRLVLLYAFPQLTAVLDNRPEISTPVTSFKSLKEGVFLYSQGRDAYDGGVFHHSPLLLAGFSAISQQAGRLSGFRVSIVFCGADIAAALFAYRATARLNARLNSRSNVKQVLPYRSPLIVATIYLFNPLLLLTTLAHSSVVFTNMFVLCAVDSALRRKPVATAFAIAVAANLSYHWVFLLLPLGLLLCETPDSVFTTRRVVNGSFLLLCTLTVILLAVSLLISRLIAGSWKFIPSVFGVNFFASVLSPNLGLWWYFFTEMFDFFQLFFKYVFEINMVVFAVPLALRLSAQPMAALALLVGQLTMLRSYPSVGDLGLFLTLCSMLRYLEPFLRYTMVVSLVFVYSLVLAPVFYHLWMVLGSGNSNFFYAISLVYTLGVGLVVADYLWAALKFEYTGFGVEPEKAVSVTQI